MSDGRYLLCRPSGGLTDTLCQIEKCLRYADRTNRVVVIDAAKSGLWGDFADFFLFHSAAQEVVGRPTPELLGKLSLMSCRPREIEGRLGTYECEWSNELLALMDSASGTKLSFDFCNDHAEDVLVHHQAGGGADLAFALLQRVSLENSIATEFMRRLRNLGVDYDAIHIRNTDYKTEWKRYLRELAPSLALTAVLVCSDDIRVIEFCREFFRDKRLLVSSTPPDTQGKALHTHEFGMSASQRRGVVEDCIFDLLALAGGRTLSYTNTTNGYPSGYSQLAGLLHTNKSVIRSLLSSGSSVII